ncbi:MAG: hypothetical protein AAF385_05350 [Pseudomonadota bacterium]
MNLLQKDRARALANSYVLGVMPRRTRQRFARALKTQPELWQEVLLADAAMQRLSLNLPDVPPSPRVWQNVADELDTTAQSNRALPWWLIVIFTLLGVVAGIAIAYAGIL